MFHPQGPTFWELARQALSSTERGYDLLAPKFDFTPFRTPDEILDFVAPHLGAPNSIERAVDLCCGTGAALRILRPLCRDKVVGVDRSRGMLQEAARIEAPRATEQAAAPVRLVRGDVLDLPFGETFDLAVCFGALGHVLPRDERRFVAQIDSILKPGGRFAFVTSEMPSKRTASYWLSRGFNAAMHVRNFLISPPFIMYYLTFLLPGCLELLDQQGFESKVLPADAIPRPAGIRLVIATKR